MEASLEGIPSIGFSYMEYAFDADFSTPRHYAKLIINHALTKGLGKANLLNVNIPALPISAVQGIKVCHQADGNWTEDFQESKDPRGQTYYWMTGEFFLNTSDEKSDIWALNNGYVSVVPTMHDMTNHAAINSIKSIEASE